MNKTKTKWNKTIKQKFTVKTNSPTNALKLQSEQIHLKITCTFLPGLFASYLETRRLFFSTVYLLLSNTCAYHFSKDLLISSNNPYTFTHFFPCFAFWIIFELFFKSLLCINLSLPHHTIALLILNRLMGFWGFGVLWSCQKN